MVGDASGNNDVLLGKMRALSRRGALLRREANGSGLIEQADGKRPVKGVTPQEFLGMIDAGWLRREATGSFMISKRGATALRGMLSRPQGSAVAAPAARASKFNPAPKPIRETAPARPTQNERESPLAWLRQRRDAAGRPMISPIEFEAGERLRADFEHGHMGHRVTASWNPASTVSRQPRGVPGFGLEMAEAVVTARQRVDAALKAVGPELSGVLLDVCCYLKGLEQAERNGGWPRRAGKVVLQLALAHLARHYGLGSASREANANEAGGGRIRAWGSEGFRPGMDAREPDRGEEPETRQS